MVADLEKQKYKSILSKFLYHRLPHLTWPVVQVALTGRFVPPAISTKECFPILQGFAYENNGSNGFPLDYVICDVLAYPTAVAS